MVIEALEKVMVSKEVAFVPELEPAIAIAIAILHQRRLLQGGVGPVSHWVCVRLYSGPRWYSDQSMTPLWHENTRYRDDTSKRGKSDPPVLTPKGMPWRCLLLFEGGRNMLRGSEGLDRR